MTHCQHLLLTPRDPLIARDGRPFGAGSGNRMKSLAWPPASVVAGSLRTLLGKAAGLDFSKPDQREQLKQVGCAGPFPFFDGVAYYPRPLDAVLEPGKPPRLHAVRPLADLQGGRTDLPAGLTPAVLPQLDDDFKPLAIPGFWSRDKLGEWLSAPSGLPLSRLAPAKTLPVGAPGAASGDELGEGFMVAPAIDERTHAEIDVNSFAASGGRLFSTVGLDLSRRRALAGDSASAIQLALRAAASGTLASHLAKLDTLHPCGGERRLVHWQASTADAWSAPASIAAALQNPPRSASGNPLLRLSLVTPAYFRAPHRGRVLGWKPDWLQEGADQLEGAIPGFPQLRVRLVAAIVDRWRPVSGWSYEPVGRQQKPGPKAVRRLVPAGSVYFLEVLGGGGLAPLAKDGWLTSICSDPSARLDGLGLAAWGVWNYCPA